MFGFLIFTAVNIFNVNGYNITDRELEERFQLIFNSSYNSKLPPGLNADEPLIVTVQLYILSIDSISDASNDFAMSFFLRQRWKDQRLAYDPVPGMPAFQLNHKSINGVWVPDIFLLNEKEADVHHVVVPNKLMHIKPDGSILYSIRVSGKFACDVDLTKYPLDQQVCPLIIESYGYTTEIVRLLWHEEAVEKREDIIMSEFDFEDVKMFKCDKTYFGLNFSCVQMNMRLDRKYGYYILQTYIPSCLIVILSWVSFWISIDATPARISLGLLTVLTMTTQSTSLPQMYYFKAIDIWMVTCLCFVFAALIEFAYVNVLARVQQRRRESTRNATVDDIKGSDSPKRRMKQTSGLCFKNMGNREKARNVDRISRVAFPFLFFMFNVIYWIVYFHVVKTCTVHKDAYRDCS